MTLRSRLARTLREVGRTMPLPSRFPRHGAPIAAALLLLATACGDASDPAKRAKGESTVDSADGLVVDTQVRRGGPYQPAASVTSGGTIQGTVAFPAQPARTDSCPLPAKTPRAIAWLADIEHGKAMDVDTRRVEVTTGRCRIEPRVQLVPSRSTINVFNDEEYAQRFDFIRGASTTPVFRTPFVARGQLVPNEQVLAEPGIVELRSDHDGLRGWLVVVDHPYAATIGDDGRFELTDVPAGSYTLAVWTPSGIVEQKVQVSSGSATSVSVNAK